jgi:hypothetical protein
MDYGSTSQTSKLLKLSTIVHEKYAFFLSLPPCGLELAKYFDTVLLLRAFDITSLVAMLKSVSFVPARVLQGD